MYKIIDLLLQKLADRLDEQELKLVVTPAAKDAIIDGGYDVTFGARPLKRYIQTHIETEVARTILKGDLTRGDSIVVDAKDGSITVTVNGK